MSSNLMGTVCPGDQFYGGHLSRGTGSLGIKWVWDQICHSLHPNFSEIEILKPRSNKHKCSLKLKANTIDVRRLSSVCVAVILGASFYAFHHVVCLNPRSNKHKGSLKLHHIQATTMDVRGLSLTCVVIIWGSSKP